MFSGDRWVRELNCAEGDCLEAAEQIRQRDQHQRGSRAYIRYNNDLNTVLQNVEQQIQELTELLNQQSITAEITEHEANRRLGLLRRLEIRYKDLVEQSKTNARENFLRKELYGGDEQQRAEASVSWADARDVPSDERIQAQQQYLKDQDEGLNQLSEIMSRTKNIAANFSTELEIHNEVLEEIDDRMVNVNDRLLRNTERTRDLSRRSDTCCLWLIILALLIAIIIVGFCF